MTARHLGEHLHNVADKLPAHAPRDADDHAIILSEAIGSDPQFLHAVLCQLGLPRNPTTNRTFERTSGRASLRLQAGAAFDGLKWVDQPLPSGTRPRLVLINLCSEAVRTRSAQVDIGGSVREFLRRLNIDCGGESMAHFRKQMLALSSCHMTLAMAGPKGTTQVDAKPIDAFQAWHTNEDGQRALWPGFIRLTDKFHASLIEHAVPLDPEAIGQLQNSAFALDVYSWLAHRLCRVNEQQGVMLPFSALKSQFGQEVSDNRNFKRRFLGALKKATHAYKDARIDIVRGGLRLLPSPPPVKRKMVALPASAFTMNDPLKGKQPSAPASTGLAHAVPITLSAEALDRVREFAPGWDKHFLERKFLHWIAGLNEPLRLPPDEAFLRWAKKISKGKPPP